MNGTPVNLLRDLPETGEGEVIDVLHQAPGLCIERIVSHGEASPPGFWYDQPQDEWVLVLTGRARLRFADEEEERALSPGDWLRIAAHRRHRIDWTDPAEPTIWLAVFHG